MTGSDLLALLAVFVGGATPWLEAIVVIPAGILAGQPAVPVVVAGAAGNLVTVCVAAFAGERIRGWWRRRRGRRGREAKDRSSRRQRIERVVRRWGLPALAVLGPVGLGTQVSAVVAVGLGFEARRSFIWIGTGTVVWSVVAAVATIQGVSLTGRGG